ncbi:MAG: hypothetical protein ACTSPD_21655 [Promethearchaeota archaeon]
MKLQLVDVFNKNAEKGIKLLNEYGKIPGGHNGPYNDQETPVRNSSHWLTIFAKMYEINKKRKFIDAVYKLAEYLISEKARPYGYSFYHRNKKRKDKCNGLIGQAWTFEALAKASEILEENKYKQIAADVFSQHPFNAKVSLWNRVEIEGKEFSIDATFNHQLWFASCSSLIKTDNKNEINQKIINFLDQIPKNLTVLDNGLIFHKIKWIWKKSIFRNYLINGILRNIYKNIGSFLKERKIVCHFSSMNEFENILMEKEIYRSIGYHTFNLYAFAILKNKYPNHKIWQNHIFKKTLKYIFNENYICNIDKNIYGFPYNAPGFEMPFILSTFFNNNGIRLVNECEKWINWQFKNTFNPETHWFDKNNPDPLTLTSRLYEITRVPDEIFNKIVIQI